MKGRKRGEKEDNSKILSDKEEKRRNRKRKGRKRKKKKIIEAEEKGIINLRDWKG